MVILLLRSILIDCDLQIKILANLSLRFWIYWKPPVYLFIGIFGSLSVEVSILFCWKFSLVWICSRTKLKQKEVDYELLKRCNESLAEENRKLHKELENLRAMMLLHPLSPPGTLTICPSCERVSVAFQFGESSVDA